MIKTHISQPVYFYNDKEIECRIGFTFKSPYLRNIYSVMKKKKKVGEKEKKGEEEDEKLVSLADKIKQEFPHLTISNVGPNYHIIGLVSGKSKCNVNEGEKYDKTYGERLAESRAKVKVFSLLRKINSLLITYTQGTVFQLSKSLDKYYHKSVKEFMHLNALEDKKE